MNKPSPIFPIGRVNLLTGKNAMHGTVWDCWEERNTDSVMIVEELDYVGADLQGTGKLRGIFSSGDIREAIGSTVEFVHDQTRARIGTWHGWKVRGIYPYTKDSLSYIAQIYNTKSISFSTYK